MDDFLRTQREVMEAYLSAAADAQRFHAGPQQQSPSQARGSGRSANGSRDGGSSADLSLDASGRSRGGEPHPGRPARLGPGSARKGLPVVPFTVMAEMLAQAAALIVAPGLVLRGPARGPGPPLGPLRGPAGVLEIRGENATGPIPSRVRVSLYHSQGEDRDAVGPGTPGLRGDRPVRRASAAARRRPAAFALARAAAEQVHRRAPLRRAMALPRPAHAGLDRGRAGEPRGDRGHDRACYRLPGSLRPGEPAAFHTDPIVLDTFTHLLGCWGLDCLEQGDVIFPLRMGELSIFGDGPGGRHTGRLPDPDPRDRAAPGARRRRARPPRWTRLDADPRLGRLAVPLAGPLSRRVPGAGHCLRRRGAAAPRRAGARGRGRLARAPGRHGPPGLARRAGVDPARPGGTGRPAARCDGPEVRRTHRLWGRIAAKEAARRLWLAAGGRRRLPRRSRDRRRCGSPAAAPGPGEIRSEPICRSSRSPTPRASPSRWRPRPRVGCRDRRRARPRGRRSPLPLGRGTFDSASRAGHVAARVDRPVPCGQAGGGQGGGWGLAVDPD